jgi:hypothetical protein
MDLKQAYENFVQAIKEETGLNPHISIQIYTHAYDNEVGKYPPVAAGVSYHIATQLGLSEPRYNTAESHQWFKSENWETRTDFAFHL